MTLHGTAVASIAAGKKNGKGHDNWWLYTHGVAYDAYIDFLTLRLNPSDGSLQSPPDASDLTYATLFNGILTLAAGDIINFSWGPSGNTIGDLSRAGVRSHWASTAAVLAQRDVADAEKKIIVWAAGNDGALSPHVLAGLGVDFPELQSHILAVVGVGKDGNIGDDEATHRTVAASPKTSALPHRAGIWLRRITTGLANTPTTTAAPH